MMMAQLPTDTSLSIRQRSVEVMRDSHGGQHAVVSFEMFSYPSENGGEDCPVVVLSKTVPYISKDPESTVRPDYDRMVTRAACELAKDFARMGEVLQDITHPE